MKKILAIVLGIFLVTFLSGIVSAAPNWTNGSDSPYGQCVAQKAEVKNTCFASVKNISQTCKAPAKEAKNKGALKQCRENYKGSKNQCRIAFKAGKEQCRALKNVTVTD